MTANGNGVSSGADGDVLELDSGDEYTSIGTAKCTRYRCILGYVNRISVLKRHREEREKARLSFSERRYSQCL